jgi:hypothetical protein
MKIPEFSGARFFGLILFFGLLAMTARNAVDPDLWWHLRTGQWIVDTGHVPHSDPFSFTRAGHAWVAHEWLSEVVFYELWKHGGAAALIVFSALVTTAGFMLLYLRCPGTRYWAAAATALGALVAAPSWGVRPQMFTFTLASLLLWLLDRGEVRPRLLFWIPPLFLLWVNLHGGFALGPALVIAYGIGVMLETAFGNTPWHEARPILLRVLLLVVACFLLVPLNPSGAQLYRYPFDTLRSAWMRSFIVEWHSPDFHQGLYRPLFLLWLLLLTTLASSRSRSESPLKIRGLAPLSLAGFAALDAVRHIPIFVLLAIPVIAAALPVAGSFESHIPNSGRCGARNFSRLRAVFNATVIVLMAVFAAAEWVSLARNQKVKEAQLFPQAAIAFLQAGDYPRDLFVYYDWGGYAIWKLYPAHRVFVDGRADLYGDELLSQAMNTLLDLRTGWREVLDRWKIEALLVPPSCALAQALLLDPHWRAEFDDSKATILFKRRPLAQNAELSREVSPPKRKRPMVAGVTTVTK